MNLKSLQQKSLQQPPLQRRISVSTWSLHHHLGAPSIYGPDSPAPAFESRALLELPAQLAAFGITTLEICHFHLPALDAGFLAELRGELERHGIELWSLLIDAGDLNDAQHAARDFEWIQNWLPVAASLGAKNVRAIAGKGAPTQENLTQSVVALKPLAQNAEANGMRLMTENWFDLTGTPEAVQFLLHELEGQIGLCLDFGNWGGPSRSEKYAELAQIAPYAESCHTKAFFRDGQIDRTDYERCLHITREAGFAGPYTLIYDSGGNEWEGLTAEREIVQPYLV
jgi:hypothetical protein